MKFIFGILFTVSILLSGTHKDAHAVDIISQDLKKDQAEALDYLTPHKALYDIKLVATRSGSQIINISGKMYYEWKPTCDAWITDHRFSLFYEYADSPGMKVTSDFSTFETFDGESFNFSARRKRDNTLYQELRGKASVADKGGVQEGKAEFTMPENLDFDLSSGAMFPMTHTLEMIKKAKSNKKFFKAVVFDGSDDEGPVEINSFIGKPVNALKILPPNEDLDMSLLNNQAWKVRMAVFPTADEGAVSDYEMSLIFHENGIISDMLIDYDDFSVTQKLVALDKVERDGSCASSSTDKAELTNEKVILNKKNDKN